MNLNLMLIQKENQPKTGLLQEILNMAVLGWIIEKIGIHDRTYTNVHNPRLKRLLVYPTVTTVAAKKDDPTDTFYPTLDGFISYANGAYSAVDTTSVVATTGENYAGGKNPIYYWYRTFLRFDISSLPSGASNISATFNAYYMTNGSGGTPEGICELAHVSDIGSSLGSEDWSASVLHDYGQFIDRSEGYGWKTKDVSSSISSPFGFVSYRLKDSVEDSDSDFFWWQIYTVDNATNKPYLQITYTTAPPVGGILTQIMMVKLRYEISKTILGVCKVEI